MLCLIGSGALIGLGVCDMKAGVGLIGFTVHLFPSDGTVPLLNARK